MFYGGTHDAAIRPRIPIFQIYDHLDLFRSIFIFGCCAVEAIMRIFLFRRKEDSMISELIKKYNVNINVSLFPYDVQS